MNDAILVVPTAFFSFLALVLVVPAWLRHRSREVTLRTISEIAAKGQALDPAVIERLMAVPRPAVGKWYALINLVLGVSALSVGTALALATYLLGDAVAATAAEKSGLMVGALMNWSIGAGLAILGVVSLRQFAGRKRPAPQWDYAAVLALICLFLGVASLSISTGLTLAAHLYVAELSGQRAAAQMLMGALVNGCAGIGFTVLSVVILKLVAGERATSP